MRRANALVIATVLLAGGVLHAQTPASFRVLLGVTDQSSTRWDGTFEFKSVGHFTLEPWRFEGHDNIVGNQFHISTRTPYVFALPPCSVVANGFIITADAVTGDSEFAFTTAQGDFRFHAAEIPYAHGTYKLDGRVYVDRLPAAVRLTGAPGEDDYPSLAAGAGGDVWLAYMQFHHSPDAEKLRASPLEIPKDFAPYAEPTGGDQIWLRKYSSGHWGEPIPVTAAGGDRFKTAVAVDGEGRPWVFWSENHEGNFDIFAGALETSGAIRRNQISKAPGADVDPAAATDSLGRVWVAWQGWRNGVAAIFAAHQEGRGFSNPVLVSNSSRNEWNPAIATDKTGRVAVAWDSYRNGNYDVYARVWSANNWGDEIPVAATAAYEAYPSIAYDPSGRLWIAYEEGGRDWGKDYGALSTSGISLYQGRLTKLRGLDPSGNLVSLAAAPDAVLVGPPSDRADRFGQQADSGSLDPDPEIARHRSPDSPDSVEINFPGVARNSLPRLAIDGSGRMWLAFRTPHPNWYSSIGTAWSEYLVSFNGESWTRPIFLNHSDNLLDNRPALAVPASGKLVIVNSSDGRRDYSPVKMAAAKQANSDPYHNDLWSDEVDLGPAVRPTQALAATAPPQPVMTADWAGVEAIQALHVYRGGPDRNLLIARGDFHRHSDISIDGVNDGTLLDQWRYALDAAGMDWIGCCDHDNGDDREYTWWITQKLTDIYYSPGKFAPMFSYERSVPYPDGHRNVIFVQRGIRPLPRFQPARLGTPTHEDDAGHTPDTLMLYAYLHQFDGIVASHTSATGMGTDWRDNDPGREPLVEIYQGSRQSYEMPGAPRSNNEKDSIGSWRPKGFVSNALEKGYRLAFEASSDHVSTHISYAILYVKDLTRESVLTALKQRHVYAATDDILADVECGSHMLGDEFSTPAPPVLKIRLRGTSRFSRLSIIRDGRYVYTSSPDSQEVELSWRDNQPNKGQVRYYYVRGEQDNGEIVWVSPMWITYTGP